MSKIICEVCGTSYPETSTQCPICGCVRPADAQSITVENKEDTPSSTYHYVKGGRFSKANVRKRNASTHSVARDHAESNAPANEKGKKKNSGNTGLIITVFVLLLAILAVIGYIVVKFFVPTTANHSNDAAVNDTIDASSPTDTDVLCQEITLDAYEITLDGIGQLVTLHVTKTPADTTEEVSYVSDNEIVASVDDNGVVTAVDFGEAVITVTCGSARAQCSITVAQPFVLDTNSVALDSIGATQTIYSGNIALAEITWSTDDELVATVSDGVVTAVGNGSTTVYGEYDGEKLSCAVTCSIPEATQQPDSTEDAAPGPYRLKNVIGVSSSDVSLRVGESFILVLLDANGDEIDDVKWTVEDGSCCTVSDGYVKAVSSGQAKVVATYNGETFSCIVRVR